MKKNIQKVVEVYKQAYDAEMKRVKGTSPIRVVAHETPFDDSSPIVAVDGQDGNFFLCGFVFLHFSPIGNSGLKPALEKMGLRIYKNYYGGLDVKLPFYGNGGNGDYEIQCVAYNAASDYLDSLGFMTRITANLD